MDNNEKPWEEYVGYWASIVPSPGVSALGMITGIDEGYATLNPFIATDYSTGEPVQRIVRDSEVPSRVKLDSLSSIFPTTEKSMKGYCKFTNAEYKRHKERNGDKKESKGKSSREDN
jgi:hypothetical protein